MTACSSQITVWGITLEVEYDATPFVPGYISGPPENCYPDEGGEIEITKVCQLGGTEDLTEVLLSAFLAAIEEKLAEDEAEDLDEPDDFPGLDY